MKTALVLLPFLLAPIIAVQGKLFLTRLKPLKILELLQVSSWLSFSSSFLLINYNLSPGESKKSVKSPEVIEKNKEHGKSVKKVVMFSC